MSKRVLILGGDAIAARVIRTARRLGLHTVLADVEPSPEWSQTADECCAAELNDPESIRQVALQYHVDGIYPPSGSLVTAAAQAAAEMGLPGPSPEAAARLANRAALWRAFAAHGVPAPEFRVARTAAEARVAADELRLCVGTFGDALSDKHSALAQTRAYPPLKGGRGDVALPKDSDVERETTSPLPPFKGGLGEETSPDSPSIPLVVRPADGAGSAGARRVEHIEDVPLAFAKAIGVSRTKTALIEPALDGEAFQVEGYVSQGRFVRLGILGREISDPPFLFDSGVFAPMPLDGAREEAVSNAVAEAVLAVGLTAGWVGAQGLYTAQGPRVVEIVGHPFCAQLPRDVWMMAEGHDSVADCLRVITGECPPARPCSRGAALYWIPTRSGIVTEIRGAEEACAIPGVEEVAIVAKPGDVMRHVVDCAARDRVGYVAAAGATAADAMAAARRARDLCEVVTRPAY